MTPTEAVQMTIAIATLVNSAAGLVIAFRAITVAGATHLLVNSMSARNMVLEKAESRAEGLASARDSADKDC